MSSNSRRRKVWTYTVILLKYLNLYGKFENPRKLKLYGNFELTLYNIWIYTVANNIQERCWNMTTREKRLGGLPGSSETIRSTAIAIAIVILIVIATVIVIVILLLLLLIIDTIILLILLTNCYHTKIPQTKNAAPRNWTARWEKPPSRLTLRGLGVRPISVLTLWISEGLTQA